MYQKYRLRSRKLLEPVSEAFEFFDVPYTIKYVQNKTTLRLLVLNLSYLGVRRVLEHGFEWKKFRGRIVAMVNHGYSKQHYNEMMLIAEWFEFIVYFKCIINLSHK